MRTAGECLRRVAECEQSAQKAVTDESREIFRRAANEWRLLARTAHPMGRFIVHRSTMNDSISKAGCNAVAASHVGRPRRAFWIAQAKQCEAKAALSSGLTADTFLFVAKQYYRVLANRFGR